MTRYVFPSYSCLRTPFLPFAPVLLIHRSGWESMGGRIREHEHVFADLYFSPHAALALLQTVSSVRLQRRCPLQLVILFYVCPQLLRVRYQLLIASKLASAWSRLSYERGLPRRGRIRLRINHAPREGQDGVRGPCFPSSPSPALSCCLHTT